MLFDACFYWSGVGGGAGSRCTSPGALLGVASLVAMETALQSCPGCLIRAWDCGLGKLGTGIEPGPAWASHPQTTWFGNLNHSVWELRPQTGLGSPGLQSPGTPPKLQKEQVGQVVFAGSVYSCMPQAPSPMASCGRGWARERPESICTIPGTMQDGAYSLVLQVRHLRCTGNEACTSSGQEHRGNLPFMGKPHSQCV